MTYAVNHLAPFLLTMLLVPALARTAPSRIVEVTSIFSHFGRVDFDDPMFAQRRYNSTRAYTQSKLANAMSSIELAERLEGSGITVNCVSPGLVATDLLREHGLFSAPWLRPLWSSVLLTPEQAADRIVRVATSPTLAGVTGQCFAASDRPILTPRRARNADARRRLWTATVDLTHAPDLACRAAARTALGVDNAPGSRTSLGELARLFLKLGTIGFGGPAAHIALMEDEVVHRRGWLTREAFLDYVSATNLMPGPNSTELAIEIGRERAGLRGLVVAGVAFIVPAAAIVTAIAWGYVRFGQLPASLALLAGVKPVIIAIVVQALWRLARGAIKTTWLAVVAAAAAMAILAGVNELLVLLGAAVLGVIAARRTGGMRAAGVVAASWMERDVAWPVVGGTLGITLTAPAVSVGTLFAVFLKIGSVLFGSGYVLLAFLRADLVERLGWLTEQQLLDAVAVGQVTPGPLFTTATFIGYVVAGVPGAVVATVGIFLPAFVFVAVSGSLIPRLRRSPTAGAALDAINAASLALMAVVTWQLGRSAIIDIPSALLALGAGAVLVTTRINSAWLVLAGGVAGAGIGLLR